MIKSPHIVNEAVSKAAFPFLASEDVKEAAVKIPFTGDGSLQQPFRKF